VSYRGGYVPIAEMDRALADLTAKMADESAQRMEELARVMSERHAADLDRKVLDAYERGIRLGEFRAKGMWFLAALSAALLTEVVTRWVGCWS
jgi:hypothetical protein